MKVLHVLQNYEPSKGGTQLLFKEVSERLHHQFGDVVKVATTNSLYDPGQPVRICLNSFENINGIEVNRFAYQFRRRKVLRLIIKMLFWLGIKQPSILNELVRVPRSRLMKSYIETCDSDVIAASTAYYTYMDYATYRFSLPNPKPFVFMGAIHFDEEPIQLPQRILDNIKASDLYIANTTFEKNALIQLGVEANKIRVVGCGVDLHNQIQVDKASAKHSLGIPKNATVVGYIGRFAASKDVLLLIKAFAELNLPNTYLLLAGASNRYLDEIRKSVEALPHDIATRVIFQLDFKESDKHTMFNSLDVFVSPSYSESFGIVFLEAWASNVPVIGANIGAIASVISHYQDGLLFKPRDIKALKEVLLVYLNNEAMRTAHAAAGLSKVKESYTWDIIATKYREIYLEAIDIFNTKCADSLA